MAEEELDVWKRAEHDLALVGGQAVAGEGQDERLKAFLLKEFDYAYGPGHVAAINPVWDQSRLDNLLKEFQTVRFRVY